MTIINLFKMIPNKNPANCSAGLYLNMFKTSYAGISPLKRKEIISLFILSTISLKRWKDSCL